MVSNGITEVIAATGAAAPKLVKSATDVMRFWRDRNGAPIANGTEAGNGRSDAEIVELERNAPVVVLTMNQTAVIAVLIGAGVSIGVMILLLSKSAKLHVSMKVNVA